MSGFGKDWYCALLNTLVPLWVQAVIMYCVGPYTYLGAGGC